jgi:hypothetical protein
MEEDLKGIWARYRRNTVRRNSASDVENPMTGGKFCNGKIIAISGRKAALLQQKKESRALMTRVCVAVYLLRRQK